MIIFSPAKINIGLQILRKRGDGFHDIATLMYLIPFADIIEIQNDQETGFSFSQSGIMVPGELKSNLCYKAWQLFSNECGEMSIKVHLHKLIPMGAGLGGGSSNGAAILKGLNSLANYPLDTYQLHSLASQLGSDCSLFIREKSSIAEGRGEILKNSPIDLSGLYLVLLNPNIEVNTTWAYKHIVPDDSRDELVKALTHPIEQWKEIITNDFEQSIFKTYPKIAKLKKELYNSGAIYASMSGSGASVYGIFREKPSLPSALAKQQIWSGRI